MDKYMKEFLAQSSDKKFKDLREDLDELESTVENINECCCDCDENSNWIEKIKNVQQEFSERIENLENEMEMIKEFLQMKFKKEFDKFLEE